MTFRRIIAAMAVAICTAATIFIFTSPAQAAESQCVMKYDKWVVDKTTGVVPLDPLDFVYRWAEMRHSPRHVYRWCRNGADYNTIEFVGMYWCSRKLDWADLPNVTELHWNTYISNNRGVVSNPGRDSMPWQLFWGNFWDVKCQYQNYPNSPVYYQASKPYWSIVASVGIMGPQRNDRIPFSGKHYVNPYYDDTLR